MWIQMVDGCALNFSPVGAVTQPVVTQGRVELLIILHNLETSCTIHDYYVT